MQLVVDSQTSFYASDLPSAVLERVMGRLSFPNPAYQEAEKRGFYYGNIPQFIRGYEFNGSQVIVPRGFTRQLLMILRKAGISYQVNDRRRTLAEVDFIFQYALKNFSAGGLKSHGCPGLRSPGISHR